MRFSDRSDAGRVLADDLQEYAGRPRVVVLALPRGGVPVALEVARALGAPLDAFVVRKLVVPGRAELAMGAIATGGARVVHKDVIDAFRVSACVLDAVIDEESKELARQQLAYRGEEGAPVVSGRTVVLVDDGIQTGSSMVAAITALRAQRPAAIVAAVPVGAPHGCAHVAEHADAVICAHTPERFANVASWYDAFDPPSDAEVRAMLRRGAMELPATSSSPAVHASP